MKKVGAIIYLGIWITMITGWIFNVAQVVQAETMTPYVMVKFAGIFIAPLGGILGWIG